MEIGTDKEQVLNLPEKKIEKIMREIESLERKMLTHAQYLSFYYDLKQLEEKFMKEEEFITRNNIQISQRIVKRINTVKIKIEDKRKREERK